MLTIYYSNKAQALVQKLSAIIAIDPLPVFTPETVVVESSAMKDWLNHNFSQQLGVSADIEFPFAAKILWHLYRKVMPELPERSSFDRPVLSLRIFALLQHGPLPQELQEYVSRLGNETAKLSFAEELAALYDQYQIYRPEWLKAWQEGKYDLSPEWQFEAELWRQLCLQSDSNDPPRSDIFFSALEKIAELNQEQLGFKRLHFFLPSNIPASYLAVLQAVAKTIDVTLFVINPSYDFWLQVTQHKHIESFEVGADENALLLLLGQQQQLFLQQLQQLEPVDVVETFIADDAADNSLLGHLQSGVTHFKQGDAGKRKDFTAKQCNIHINSCHHRMREVQVLHDHLLKTLADNPELSLQDIAVMVPDIDSYAPYFSSVFRQQNTHAQLDYHLSERNSFEDIAVFRIALAILRMAHGGFKRDDFEALLDEPLLLDSLGIDDAALLKQLLEELNVRFALDDASWHKLGEQVVSLSFEQAYQRLLKSYASEGVSDDCVPGIEASVAEQCAHVLHYLDLLKPLQAMRDQNLTLNLWCDFFAQLMQQLIDSEQAVASEQLPLLVEALQELGQWQTLANFNESIGLLMFMQLLEKTLQANTQQHQFKPGVINIASLLPMRNLPFKHVCLLGMNDGEYPAVPSFDYLDLMQRYPQHGDRNKSQEQRYLFLQALLSAEQGVYISYIGQSAYDNSEQLPSLLVDELLTFIDRYYTVNLEPASLHVLQKHPLQAFDTRYFSENSGYYTYNRQHYQQCLAASKKPVEQPFIQEALGLQTVTTIMFYSFYQGLINPSRWLLQNLQANLLLEQIPSAQHLENFASDGLDKYQLLQSLFWQTLATPEFDAHEKITHWVRQGLLPQAIFADLELDTMLQQSQAILARYHGLFLGLFADSLAIEHRFDNGQQIIWATGQLNIEKQQYLSVVSRSLKAKHFFKAWLEHLLLQCEAGSYTTYLLSVDSQYRFDAISPEVAKDYLQQYLQQFNQGQVSASAFCLEPMFDYWDTLRLGKADKAYAQLQQTLAVDNEEGLLAEVHWQHVYQGRSLDIDKVIQLAEVFMPALFENLRELNL